VDESTSDISAWAVLFRFAIDGTSQITRELSGRSPRLGNFRTFYQRVFVDTIEGLLVSASAGSGSGSKCLTRPLRKQLVIAM